MNKSYKVVNIQVVETSGQGDIELDSGYIMPDNLEDYERLTFTNGSKIEILPENANKDIFINFNYQLEKFTDKLTEYMKDRNNEDIEDKVKFQIYTNFEYIKFLLKRGKVDDKRYSKNNGGDMKWQIMKHKLLQMIMKS